MSWYFVVEVLAQECDMNQLVTAEDVKNAIEGDGCSVECETRGLQVVRITPFEHKPHQGQEKG